MSRLPIYYYCTRHELDAMGWNEEPGVPHGASSVPSPAALQVRAAPLTHATKSPGVQVAGVVQSSPAVQVPDCDIALAHGTGGSLGTRMGSATLILGREDA